MLTVFATAEPTRSCTRPRTILVRCPLKVLSEGHLATFRTDACCSNRVLNPAPESLITIHDSTLVNGSWRAWPAETELVIFSLTNKPALRGGLGNPAFRCQRLPRRQRAIFSLGLRLAEHSGHAGSSPLRQSLYLPKDRRSSAAVSLCIFVTFHAISAPIGSFMRKQSPYESIPRISTSSTLSPPIVFAATLARHKAKLSGM